MATSGNSPPTAIATKALAIFTETSSNLSSFPNDEKSDCGTEVAFLGLLGAPVGFRTERPYAPTYMREDQKAAFLIRRSGFDAKDSPQINRGINRGLTFTQTPILGRFGRTPIKPLYKKHYPDPYTEILTETDARIPEWWDAPVRTTIPRIVEIESPRSEILIDADAAAGELGAS